MEANSTGDQGSRRAVAPSDGDDDAGWAQSRSGCLGEEQSVAPDEN